MDYVGIVAIFKKKIEFTTHIICNRLIYLYFEIKMCIAIPNLFEKQQQKTC